MKIETVSICKGDPSITLTYYVTKSYPEIKRDAMLVIPGGRYANVCAAHEGYPVADLIHHE